MPDVNLTTLNGPELRRLLDASRERGQAALSYQILQEMAARREGRGRRGFAAMRRPGEPRIVAVDLGDPLDELPHEPEEASAAPPLEPEPAPRPASRRSRRRNAQAAPVAEPAQAAADAEPTPPSPEVKRPRSVWDADPEPEDEAEKEKGWALRLHPPELPSLRALRPRRGPGASFAVGIAAGVALGWWVGGITRETPAPRVAPAAAPVQVAAAAPARAPVTTPVAAPVEPEPLPAPVGVLPPDQPEGPVPSPDAEGVAQDVSGEALELPAPPAATKAEAVKTPEPTPTEIVRAAPAGTDACAAQPTPADRSICADPELRRLQRELRQAYADALQAHQDRALLRERQLAWADARDNVSEPDRLARLYEARIRKLNAATAEARRQR